MKIFFRADASVHIGTGHVMRCLTLADALKARGNETAFICRPLPGDLTDYIEKRGHDVHRILERLALPGNQQALGCAWQQDAKATLAVLQAEETSAEWLVVDHYSLDRQWECQTQAVVKHIFVIDDLANRPHHCQLLLDQNHVADQDKRYNGLVPAECARLLGTRFTLLRPEFAQIRSKTMDRDGALRRILVNFGGTDPANATAKVLEAFKQLDDALLAIDVVVGAQNAHCDIIQQKCNELSNATFHQQVENMADLMANADLAIGAGGSSTWERCCLGLPTITLDIADNQKPLSEMLAREGRTFYLGQANKVSATQLIALLRALQAMPDWLRFVGQSAQSLVDGQGVQRVVRQLLSPAISLRPASHEDSDMIFSWRNAEETRAFSFNSAPINKATHEQWLTRVLNDPKRDLLVGYADGRPIGVLRYDRNGQQAEISIYLAPGMHGQGLGQVMIEAGTKWLCENHPEVEAIQAAIMESNRASTSAFIAAGYNQQYTVYQKDLKGE